jgi:hypothetical protein
MKSFEPNRRTQTFFIQRVKSNLQDSSLNIYFLYSQIILNGRNIDIKTVYNYRILHDF